MKTLTILLIGAAATIARPAFADHDYNLLGQSQQAHSLAAHLAAATTPYAPYNAAWDRAAHRAVEADHATESLISALAIGDYCAARDIAEQLKDLADDLEDAVEDLRPLPGGPCDHDIHSLEHLADDLDKLAGLLRRETRRLDERQVIAPPVAPICTVVAPQYDIMPSNRYQFGFGVQSSPSRYQSEIHTPPQYAPTPYNSFGPGSTIPSREVPSRSHGYGDSFYGNQNTWPNATGSGDLPPGLQGKSKIPPGQLKKIDPSQYGPAFPGASRQPTRHRISYR